MMDSIIKSEKALDILTTISLAQFIIILALLVGIGVITYKFKDHIKDFLEDYREKENAKEDFIEKVNNHEVEIKAIKKHHEDDMQINYNNQLKYREQSLEKQAQINRSFEDIDNKIEKLTELILTQHEETKRLKCNELRDKLLNSYRYFTSLEHNPEQVWNEMEAEAFWHLFSDYEEMGGNGFMHQTVKPAMEKLTIIKISDL